MINLVNEGVLIMLTYSKIMMIIIMVTFGQHGNDQLRLKWCGTLSTRHGDIPSIVKEMAMITNELVKIIFCGLILMKLLRMGVSRVTIEETLHPFVFCF